MTGTTPFGVQEAGRGVLTRRALLQRFGVGAVALAAVPVLPPPAPPVEPGVRQAPPTFVNPRRLNPFQDALPVPPVWSGAELSSRGLTMAEGRHVFHRMLAPSRTWGYGGLSYLGPTMEVATG